MKNKNQKGITLIALVITIIIMLILVGATITILTQGDLINKAKDAAIGTDELAKNETNRMNELGAEIENAVNGNSTLEYNKAYSFRINPNPPESSEIEGMIFEDGEFYIELSNIGIYIQQESPALKLVEGEFGNNNFFTKTETPPENPNEGDIYSYYLDGYKVYEYTNRKLGIKYNYKR